MTLSTYNAIYQRVSRATIKNVYIKVFELEKEKIKKIFKSIDRISLTSDWVHVLDGII